MEVVCRKENGSRLLRREVKIVYRVAGSESVLIGIWMCKW